MSAEHALPLSRLHLVDTSAWAKSRNDPELSAAFNESVRRDKVATCDVVVLELLRSARDQQRFERQVELLDQLRNYEVERSTLRRAKEVQAELVAAGKHRGVKPIDLIVAAVGELMHLPVLHYDHDFDLVAGVTGQEVTWLAPRGSLP